MTRRGFSDKARRSASIARHIRHRFGQAAYDRYKKYGTIPSGFDVEESAAYTSLPIKPWVAPPPPKGRPGERKAGGVTARGETNTRMGDLAERTVQQLGLRSLLPEGKRQNPLDTAWRDTNIGFEVKAVSVEATEYKVKMKQHERNSKIEYSQRTGMVPATMMVVMDVDGGRAYVYWRAGIVNGRLDSNSWHHMGIISL